MTTAPHLRRTVTARWTLALTVTVAGSSVWAEVPLRYTSPGFTAALPDGYVRVAVNDPPTDLLDTFRHGGSLQGPVVVQLVVLRAEVPQRPLTVAERAALRRSDPSGVVFQDTLEHVRSVGFDLEALAGRARIPGGEAVRFSTAVPVWGDGVLVTVIAPAGREPEARQVFRSLLASVHTRTSWSTPGARRMARAGSLAGRTALGLSAGYALLALMVFRGGDRWRRARAAGLSLAAGAWVLMSVGMLFRPERPVAASVVALTLGLATAVTAARVAWSGTTPGAPLGALPDAPTGPRRARGGSG